MIPENSYALFFWKDQLLLEKRNINCIIPIKEISSNIKLNLNSQDYFFLEKVKSKNIYAVYLDSLKTEIISNFVTVSVRDILNTVAALHLSKLILRGKQLINWHRNSLYCGSCGSATLISELETAKICPSCNKLIYPCCHPAIILLIENEDKILLARSPHFPAGMYSTLAGFIEAGESCEDAIKREVAEEVGISVKNIQYFGSQSWPFPNSFMIGFKALYESGEICLKDKELEDAKWFNKDNLPVLPSISSIARHMIDSYLNQDKLSFGPRLQKMTSE